MNKISATSRSLAKEVIEGKWGNDAERVRRLTEAGYNATHIQDVVNQMYINGEVEDIATGNSQPSKETTTSENIKVIEIDTNEYDGLKIVLVM